MKSRYIFLAITLFTSISLAENVTLTKNKIYKVSGKGVCGFVNKKWKPVKKVTGSTYKTISGSSSLKAVCKSLLVAKKLSLHDLPSAAGLVAASATTRHVSASSVSGTPPTLGEIATNGASTIFWRSGVISGISGGSPTDEQCFEFFGSSTDGQSAGYPGCYMAQENGYVMQNIIQSGNTLCYMKNFPTREVQDAGGFTVDSGSLPSGGITQLFAPPSGDTPRFVKINIEQEGHSQTGILKIYSQNQNATSGDQFRYDMIFCDERSNTPREYEKTRVTLSGEFIAKNSSSFGGHDDSDSGRAEGTVRAFLTRVDGSLEFNPELGRSAIFTGVNNGFQYKSSMTLEGDEITNKTYSIETGRTRKGYSVSHINGSSAATLKFLEGAYKEQNTEFGTFSTAVEYRDSVYLAAPASSYATRLNEVDIGSDGFYNSAPSLAGGSAPISCNQRADIELSLNMNSDAMRAVSSECEGERLDGMNFCQDSTLQEAQSNYGSACHPGTH